MSRGSMTVGVFVKDIEFLVPIHTWPASRGIRENGLALEPDEPAGWEIDGDVTVVSVGASFDDICSITYDDIETAVQKELEEMADDEGY